MQGHFYYHRGANAYLKSLGFRRWAALGVAASAKKVGDQVAKPNEVICCLLSHAGYVNAALVS